MKENDGLLDLSAFWAKHTMKPAVYTLKRMEVILSISYLCLVSAPTDQPWICPS